MKTCAVLEQNESRTHYERARLNHDALVNVWRASFTVRNQSGKYLEDLIVNVSYSGTSLPCTTTEWNISQADCPGTPISGGTLDFMQDLSHSSDHESEPGSTLLLESQEGQLPASPGLGVNRQGH